MRTTRWIAVIASTLTLAVAGACGGINKSSPGDVSSGSIAVTVTNNNFTDMDIYAVVDGGIPMRIGTATGLTTSKFNTRPDMFSTGTLRLVATSIGSPISSGGGIAARSGPLLVNGGSTVEFTIQPDLAASFGVVR